MALYTSNFTETFPPTQDPESDSTGIPVVNAYKARESIMFCYSLNPFQQESGQKGKGRREKAMPKRVSDSTGNANHEIPKYRRLTSPSLRYCFREGQTPESSEVRRPFLVSPRLIVGYGHVAFIIE